MRRFPCHLLLLCLATGLLQADVPVTQIDQAIQKGDHATAASLLGAATMEGKSPELFYNLGNALWELGRQGEATLWYRRALLLSPSMPEARQNLDFVRLQTGYLEDPAPSWRSLADRAPKDYWIITFTATFWLTILFWIAAARSKSHPGRQSIAILLTILFLLVAGFSGTLWYLKSKDHPQSQAVVTSSEAAIAYTTASATGDPVADLPPGSLVRSVEERGAWVYADLPGNLRGWLRKEALTPLWPWEKEWLQ